MAAWAKTCTQSIKESIVYVGFILMVGHIMLAIITGHIMLISYRQLFLIMLIQSYR